MLRAACRKILLVSSGPSLLRYLMAELTVDMFGLCWKCRTSKRTLFLGTYLYFYGTKQECGSVFADQDRVPQFSR